MNLAQPSMLQRLFERLQGPQNEQGMGGLVALIDGQSTALPLLKLKVRSNIAGNCAQTVVEQHFQNSSKSTIEVTHIFPLPEQGALIAMELISGDCKVQGVCQEKNAAIDTYEDAQVWGKRVALITQERDDVHTLKVSGIAPNTDVIVRFTIIEFLDCIDGRFIWRFPTAIAPRFRPGKDIGHQGPGILHDSDRVPDASFLHAPARLAGGTAFDLEVKVAVPVREIEANFHTVNMSMMTDGLKISPTGQATLNKDFVLAFSNGDEDDICLRAWTDGAYSLALIGAPSEVQSKRIGRDAVYCIDISGSMKGLKLEAAKRALSKSLMQLRAGDRFQLIAFDTRAIPYKGNFQEVHSKSLRDAINWIQNLRVCGGTDMLPAIQMCFAGETPRDRLRTVLFITDGQASNDEELVAAVANRRKGARFFTLGIDTAVNSALLQRLSRVGGGTCELTGPHGDIESLVSKIEERFCDPIIQNVTVEGGELGFEGEKALFQGRPITVLLKGSPSVIRCQGQSSDGSVIMEVKPARSPMPLGALWGKRRIAYLQDRLTLRPFEAEALKPIITEIALEHSLLSKYTAFVAVDETSKVSVDPHKVIQPVETPDLWAARPQGTYYRPRSKADMKLTADGACIGTPYFVSPEQLNGNDSDARSDIYSLGVVFYELLTGRRPHSGRTFFELLRQIRKEKIQDPRKLNPEIPKVLAKIILKMTYMKPKHRFQSCEEVLEALHKMPLQWDRIPTNYRPTKNPGQPYLDQDESVRALIGRRVFGYVLEGLRDRGEGWIFEASNADKSPALVSVLPKSNERYVERLVKTLKAAVAMTSELKSPHIARSLAMGEDAEYYFVLHDYLEGENLTDHTRTWTKPPIEEILIFLHQALLALAEAHNNGFLHSHLKKSSFFVTKRRFLRMTDFEF